MQCIVLMKVKWCYVARGFPVTEPFLPRGSRDKTLLPFSTVNLESSKHELTFIFLYC